MWTRWRGVVLLTWAAATSAGGVGADDLFAEAREVHATRFWDAAAGRCVEERSRDWSVIDDYRGANSNMHVLEADLFTADAHRGPDLARAHVRHLRADHRGGGTSCHRHSHHLTARGAGARRLPWRQRVDVC